MPQPFDKLSHKRRTRRLLLLGQLLETLRDPVPALDIEMTTAIGRTINTAAKTTGVTTTTVAITTIAEGTTIAATITTVVTRSTIGRMTIVVTIIATATTPTNGNQGTTKATTGRKMYARSGGAHATTTGEGHAPQGLNHHVRMSIKNGNWYR